MVEEFIPYHRPMIEYGESHIISNGPRVQLLEQGIKELYDVEYAIATSSCTQGLLLCAWYLSPPVIALPAFTWWTVREILDILKIPHQYSDIDARTWLQKDSSIMCVIGSHTFGNICRLSTDHSIIYDGAHALGAAITDFGLATVFSLAPTKPITCCEGGMILTNDPGLAAFAVDRRNGLCRLSEPNADYGLYTLSMLDDILEWKRNCYHYYKSNLPGIFQEIPYSSNYNTIGMLTDLKIPPHIEYKQYYQPVDDEDHLKTTRYIYNKIVCLPSWFGCDIEKIVHDILEYNEDLEDGKSEELGTMPSV